MLLVGLTGGIGSGKSTVAAQLAARGAAVVDADGISRQILEPDGAAFDQVVDRFGPSIVGRDGRIDRPALAGVVFGDPEALADLNRLTHPVIGRVMSERVAELAATSPIVVLDIPLLTIATKDRFSFGAIVVVDTPEEVAVRRLVEHRGFTEADARARVAAQITREERRALADLVIDNSGDRGALESEVERAWAWLSERG
ncbi:MAG TPA: dephospho-CoA kinase [Acidimicrobiales bacterium]|nr:dephospho-CoA kinase [Acidimicrobiales bacterium]